MTSKHAMTVIAVVVGAACVVAFGFAIGRYLDRQTKEYEQRREAFRATDPDVVACRQAHGLPVFSSWDGALIDCKPLPTTEAHHD